MARLAMLLGAVAVLVAGVASWLAAERHDAPPAATVAPPYAAQKVEPPKDVADFTLTDQDGRSFRLSESAGRVRLLYFGYTSCPDVCPTTLSKWRSMKKQLGDLAGDVQFIMVTVDPDADTQAQMKRYMQLFDPSFIGLSGSAGDLKRAWDAFGVHPQRFDLRASQVERSGLVYVIAHPVSVYVLDGDGKLRLEIPFHESADDAARDNLHLIGQTS